MKELFKGVILLASGAGIARIVGLLSIPLLTRIYLPEHFGILAVYASVLQILVPFSTLRYLMAIPLPRSDQTAFAIFTLSMSLVVVFTVFLFLLVALAGTNLLAFFSLTSLMPFVWLIPMGVFGASLYEIFMMWATRKREYKTIAKTQVWQAISSEGIKLLLGFLWGKPIGLLLGHMLGQAGGGRFLLSHFKLDFINMIPTLRWRQIHAVAHRFKGFPTYRLPAQILLAVALQAPVLLTEAFYDTGTTGQMGLAMIAFTLPFSLIGQAASRAYFAELVRIHTEKTDSIINILKKTTLTLGLIATPVAILLVLFGENGATILLGENWAQSGRFVSALGIALVPQFVSSTVIRTLDVLEAHKTVLLLHLTRLILVSAVFAYFAHTGAPADHTVLAFGLALALHYMIQLTVIICIVRHSQGEQQ